MGTVLQALGHETRELLARIIGENEGVTGARLLELAQREDGRELSKSAFWFHLNHLRNAGVVKARKRRSASLDSDLDMRGKAVETGNPVYLSLNRAVVKSELERLVRDLGLRLMA